MKIYEANMAPNARRVRIFLAEKGIDMDYEQVDIMAGENLSDEFKRKNLTTKIPVLELDDGTFIGESVAICRYFEELHPENPLMGSTPKEKAEIEMWHRRVELHLLVPMAMAAQHGLGFFKDRMTPIPAWGEESRKLAQQFLDDLEVRLGESTYIAGEHFSIADILALCCIDFAALPKIALKDSHTNIKRWHQLVSSRPSAAA